MRPARTYTAAKDEFLALNHIHTYAFMHARTHAFTHESTQHTHTGGCICALVNCNLVK